MTLAACPIKRKELQGLSMIIAPNELDVCYKHKIKHDREQTYPMDDLS